MLFISIATGFIFCFATIYAQNAMTNYVNRQVLKKTGENPMVHMALASNVVQQEKNSSLRNTPGPEVHSPPPGSGERWTPLAN